MNNEHVRLKSLNVIIYDKYSSVKLSRNFTVCTTIPRIHNSFKIKNKTPLKLRY